MRDDCGCRHYLHGSVWSWTSPKSMHGGRAAWQHGRRRRRRRRRRSARPAKHGATMTGCRPARTVVRKLSHVPSYVLREGRDTRKDAETARRRLKSPEVLPLSTGTTVPLCVHACATPLWLRRRAGRRPRGADSTARRAALARRDGRGQSCVGEGGGDMDADCSGLYIIKGS